MYIIHEQRQRTNLVVTSIYLITSIILLLAIFSPNFLKIDPLPRVTRIILFLVLLVDLVIFKSFWELKFRITNEGLEFGYGFFKNKVAKNNIQSVTIENSKGNFFGYGVRFGKDKTMGFIAQKGEGLKIVSKERRKFFITIDMPEEALNIIKQNNYI